MQSNEIFFVLDKEKDQMQLYRYFCLFVYKNQNCISSFINATKIRKFYPNQAIDNYFDNKTRKCKVQ